MSPFVFSAVQPLSGILKSALPSFTSLQEFEWIGYPELREEFVQAVLAAHPRLHCLGTM